jgi:flagellar basal body-associated protein FliL
MNTKHVVWIVLGVIIVLALGIGGGYFMGQQNKEQEISSAKQAAADEAKMQAEAEASKPKEDADKTPQEKAPAKVATDTTCNADELTLSIEDAGDQSGVGTLAYNLILTNSAQRVCTLYGFPGVSLVNDNGNQIGTPAERGTNYIEERLTLQPGTKVRSVLSIANSSNFPDGECKTGATKVRVYPPNDTGYLSVASNISSWCPGFTVSPVLKI